jgi:predicted enzyme related to lactoylglutathione lyase
MVDHVHLAATDQAKAVEWYRKHFGGEPMTEGPDRLMFGETRVLFQLNKDAKPSAGSVFDHVGFSVADLDATLKAVEADGAKVEGPARDVEGLFKLAFVVDPWGVRLEIVQDDPAKLGLHHLHLRAPDPAKVTCTELAKATKAANPPKVKSPGEELPRKRIRKSSCTHSTP